MGKPSWYVTSHSGQLSLAIPSWKCSECQRKQGHKQAHCATHWPPYPWSRSVKTGVWLRAKEMEISAALWALYLGKDFTFLLLFTFFWLFLY